MSIGERLTAPVRTRRTKPGLEVVLDDFFSQKKVRPAVHGECHEIVIKDLPVELLGQTTLASHIENPTLLQTRFCACVTLKYKNKAFGVSPVTIRVIPTRTGKKLAIMWNVNEEEFNTYYPQLAKMPYLNDKDENTKEKEEKPSTKKTTKSSTKANT